jgi:hypothetical protein
MLRSQSNKHITDDLTPHEKHALPERHRNTKNNNMNNTPLNEQLGLGDRFGLILRPYDSISIANEAHYSYLDCPVFLHQFVSENEGEMGCD